MPMRSLQTSIPKRAPKPGLTERARQASKEFGEQMRKNLEAAAQRHHASQARPKK